MYCAVCGNKIDLISCCNNLGYWYNKEPHPMDFVKLNSYKGYFLYLNLHWPKGLKVTKPRFV